MSLSDDFDAMRRMGVGFPAVPDHVRDNLRPTLRAHQEEAIGRFLYYRDSYPQRKTPAHLLFHMATGSGKTLVMAALILELFTRGHRDFLFVVDKTQIVDKTKANFLDAAASKFLFADPIRVDDRPVAVRAVDNFADSDPASINIRFTTLGTLHSQINGPRENGLTIEDFADRSVVVIADEAHHLNAETRANPDQGELKLRDSWEGTVNAIFRANLGNVMLDFTATQDFRNAAIAAKYDDKILLDFSLRQFREAGYSKDIMLRSVGADIDARMMQAAVLSEHRRRLAAANGLAIKPVVLMKSRKIDESRAAKASFHALIDDLDANRILQLRDAVVDPTLRRAFAYILDERGVAPADLARDLRRQFAPDHAIDANDDRELEARQLALNTLEDPDNAYRVVFAVDKLNEGWDVLNLFDIVRLYDTAPTNGTSNAEKQLIGRGARYCPFVPPDQSDAPPECRKYDNDLDAPLRLLEQLHYHCAHDPDYIRHIKERLVESGAIAADAREVTLRLKDGFRESAFFKSGWVWSNRLIPHNRAGMTCLADYEVPRRFRHEVASAHVTEGGLFGAPAATHGQVEPVMRRLTLASLGTALIRHALAARPFFRFDRLRRHFPQLAGVTTFIESPQFLGGIEVELRGPGDRLDALTTADRLGIAHHALRGVEAAIKSRSVDTKGSTEFRPDGIAALFGADKTIKLADGDAERSRSWRESPILRDLDLDQKDWFVFDDAYGTSEEKHFIRWLNDRATDLRDRYEEFYLIRNERVVKLYDFDDGARFEPDFLLFLRRREEGEPLTIQLFIEPKGTHLEQADGWKQRMLGALERRAVLPIVEGREFWVFGLPFFNEEAGRKQGFEQAFDLLA